VRQRKLAQFQIINLAGFPLADHFHRDPQRSRMSLPTATYMNR
jgi:hypothetical protein